MSEVGVMTRVGVAGDRGRLHSAVADRLRGETDREVVRIGIDGPPTACDLVVVIADGAEAGPPEPDGGRRPPWLPVRVEWGVVVIGPAALPGVAGCPTCAASRVRKARADAQPRRQARERFARRFAATDVRLTPFASAVAAELVTAEVAALGSPHAARTRRGVVHLRLDDLATSVHRFLPEPDCPDCGGVPDDTEAAARLALTSRAKLAPDVYRVRDLRADVDQLVDTYVDAETGFIRGLYRSVDGSYPTTSAPMGQSTESDVTETGFGRDLDFRTSQATAIAEAVERHGGGRPGGKRTVVRGTYRELADRALDPKTLGLYPDERYTPGFGFERYTDDRELRWVWGHSFARDRAVLVPESCVYYRLHQHSHDDAHDVDRPFVYEISNGCALGGCVEEAILHGILELAERDAFLLTWYARLPVRRLDLGSAVDRRIPLMAERLHHDFGYDVHVFDTTTEHGIPSVWAMAVHPTDDDAVPKALCAAGAAFAPERAVANAMLELAPMLGWLADAFGNEQDRALRMLADPDQVRSMHDHSLVNAHHRAFARLKFLFECDRRYAIAESFADAFRPRADDLTVDLSATVARYLERGQDVVVVDQTTPEHVAGGFRCVKVIIPGLLPMTFGHRMRRVDGLPRLYDVPHLLGYTEAPLRPEDVNHHPHPFP